MREHTIDNILPCVERPSRYIGGEVNSIKKELSKCRLTFALAFPDAYEVGMSHLGLQILYFILNASPNIACERFFAPWPDMEQQMRTRGIALASLESAVPLDKFDIVGFSLQYELSYTNVLNMLDLGGVPIYGVDRNEGTPLVIAGGPAAFNPEPMSPFIDAFVIGEGEEVIMEIARATMEGKQKQRKRNDLLHALAAIDGVYVPALHVDGEKVRKRIIRNLDDSPLPTSPIVPLTKTIHDRITLEIARGCSRGCRFCQAGMVWRPTRERNPENLMNMAETMLASTGHDEISLLSLSSGDYSCIDYLLTSLMDRYFDEKIALALPSMRVETLTDILIEQIKRVRKTSFTLAPEAGTQRLRNIINKGNTEENLLKTTRSVFDAGWRSVKLYFMIGLPDERQEDLEGIADLAYKVLKEGGFRRQVTVSLSSFVPKPHTPFQWVRQIGLEEIKTKQDFLKDRIRHRNLNLRWSDRRVSLLEGLLSRGDRALGELIAAAFRAGCRFDGWGDQLRFDLWEEAMKMLHVDAAQYLQERQSDCALPWDHIDCGLTREFLVREYEKSPSEELTEDCRFGVCHKCGVCDKNTTIRLAVPQATDTVSGTGHRPAKKLPPPNAQKFRIRFFKHGKARLLSHLEVASTLVRGIRKSGLQFVFTEGFHPHPKISFAFATPVGVESSCEFADIQIKNPPLHMHELVTTINRSLPEGLEISEIEKIPLGSKSLFTIITGYQYVIYLPDALRHAVGIDPAERIQDFIDRDVVEVTRTRKGKTVTKNIRPFVAEVSFDESEYKIDLSVAIGSNGGVTPREILKSVIGLDDDTLKTTKVCKVAPIFADRK